MASRQIFNISAFRTASRCWLPVNAKQVSVPATLRHFSSRQRSVNFANVREVSVVSNDTILIQQIEEHPDTEGFEPTVFSSEEVHTPGPVNRG
ncbi:hypothetical protein CLIB1423_38S00232 [[Candida] railenensis]|uniref:Uncharacterized protein n=1 Tax=[Candida] railenensis TaxID=45579 RepID=A0A9P0W1S5_9ASCO|nr:hypothetical protein CLIB1423_38S00232 [[Candida] railenensis]